MGKTSKKPIGRPVTKGDRDKIRSIRVPDDEWEAWREAAKGTTIAKWLRALANRAARNK